MIERGDLESDPGMFSSNRLVVPPTPLRVTCAVRTLRRLYELGRIELINSCPLSTQTLRPDSPLFRFSPPIPDSKTRMERWIRRSRMGRSSRKAFNLVCPPEGLVR